MPRKTKARKTIALIAHDGKKAEMVAFALSHQDVLERYALVATNTTGKLLSEKHAPDGAPHALRPAGR